MTERELSPQPPLPELLPESAEFIDDVDVEPSNEPSSVTAQLFVLSSNELSPADRPALRELGLDFFYNLP